MDKKTSFATLDFYHRAAMCGRHWLTDSHHTLFCGGRCLRKGFCADTGCGSAEALSSPATGAIILLIEFGYSEKPCTPKIEADASNSAVIIELFWTLVKVISKLE